MACVSHQIIVLISIVSIIQGNMGFGFREKSKQMSHYVTSLLDSLLAENTYDKRIRPDFGGPPIVIETNMYIKSLGPISETDEVYTMDCYFRQSWLDRRLQFNSSGGLGEFSMNWLFIEKVWKPDTYFVNGRKSYLHSITVPNKFLRLGSDGRIIYSMRLTIKASCPMNLRKFPLDSQTCPLLIGSYGYSSDDVRYEWKRDGAVGKETGLNLAQYDLVNISVGEELRESSRRDRFSILLVRFVLQRHTGYFMLQVYVPCTLIVCCSWVSFWIDADAVPARVALGVTTVLSMTTLGFGGRSQMPRVSYATALDWFVILCFAFVFASMVEYAAINYFDKIRKDLKKKAEELKKKMAASNQSNTTPRAQGSRLEVPPTIIVDQIPYIDQVAAISGDKEPGVGKAPLADQDGCAPSVSRWRDSVCRHLRERRMLALLKKKKENEEVSDSSGGEVEKFSSIDMKARKGFPLCFGILNTIYWVAFMHYISDEPVEK